jgi:predicted DNA-binding transcriptional regulator AlpA
MEDSAPAPAIDRRTPVTELPQYLTIPEIESYLQIGRSSAYEFARKHGVKIGRLVRVPREALELK